MLLRVGVISMACSLLIALAVAAVVVLRDGPENAAAEPAAAQSEPESRLEAGPRTIPVVESADLSKEAQPEDLQPIDPEPGPDVVSRPQRESPAQPEPPARSEPAAPEPEPEPRRAPQAAQDSLPVASTDWPAPKEAELEKLKKPRRYNSWPAGAILTLTVEGMGLYNAPVMRTDSQQALDNGIVHVPETSLPWDRTPQTNVYLAGHRLGWPGTGSRLIFYNLNRLSDGDEVLLKDRQGKRYKYRVSEKFIVGPYDSWVMGQVRNRDMVTLQTCTGPNFEKRLIVRADRV